MGAMDAVAKSRDFLLTLDDIPFASILVDSAGSIVFVNGRAEKLFDFKKEELFHQPIELLVPDNAQKDHKSLVKNYFLKPETRVMGIGLEVFAKKKDASLVPVEVALRPISFNGKIHALVFLVDIAPRRETEEQLRRSQRLGLLGKIAGGISHDINNKLAIIKANLDALSGKEGLSENSQKKLKNVFSSIKKSSDLTKKLLALGRAQELDKKKVEMVAAVSEMLNPLKRVIRSNINLHYEHPKDKLYAFVDPIQIDQVLMNLVINAQDAIGSDPGDITVSLSKEECSQEFCKIGTGFLVKISVQDSGPGIGGDIIEKIFDPFFSSKGEEKGTGLGLAVVDGIVNQHGGHLEVSSIIGNGATFTIFLPEHS